MPCDGELRRTRYVPGKLFSVNAATSRTVRGSLRQQRARRLRVRDEYRRHGGGHGRRAARRFDRDRVCGRDQSSGAARAGAQTSPPGSAQRFAKGEELGRFNMGSTVIVVFASSSVTLEGAAAGRFQRASRAGDRLRLSAMSPRLATKCRLRDAAAASEPARPRARVLRGTAALEVETPLIVREAVTDVNIESLAVLGDDDGPAVFCTRRPSTR